MKGVDGTHKGLVRHGAQNLHAAAAAFHQRNGAACIGQRQCLRAGNRHTAQQRQGFVHSAAGLQHQAQKHARVQPGPDMAGRHRGKAHGKAVLVHAVLYFYKGRRVAREMKAPVKPVYDVQVQMPQCKQKIAVARKKRLRPVRYRKAGTTAGGRAWHTC